MSLLIALLLSATCYSSQKPIYWIKNTQTNLNLIKSTITDCVSPLLESDQNKAWLDKGQKEAMKMIRSHPSYYGEMFALYYYSRGFHEPHFGVSLNPIYANKNRTNPNSTITKSPNYTGNVYAITDYQSFSATLLLLDYLKEYKHFYQLGYETNTDSYMGSILSRKLQDGFYLVYPTSFAKLRKRKRDESHKPDFVYPGDIYDSAKLKSWVEKIVNQTDG